MNREILKALLDKAQDRLINELCGKKYDRTKDNQFKRAGTTSRALITRHGTNNLPAGYTYSYQPVFAPTDSAVPSDEAIPTEYLYATIIVILTIVAVIAIAVALMYRSRK